MVVFGLILTTFESSSIFGGSWGSIENWPPSGNLACTKSVKRSVASRDLLGLLRWGDVLGARIKIALSQERTCYFNNKTIFLYHKTCQN